MRSLSNRVTALEGQVGTQGLWPVAWIEAEDGETEQAARARYEAVEGPIGDRLAIIWMPPCHA